MKTIVVTVSLSLLLAAQGRAQSEDIKWNIGIHGGAHQYNGDIGNGWYRTNQAYYGFAGVSLSRYLSRHFDLTLLGTRGEMGHVMRTDVPVNDVSNDHFLVRLTTVNLHLRYFPFGRTRFIQPYLLAGGGILLQQGLHESTYRNRRPFDLSLPSLGAGLQFPLGNFLAVQLQETFIHPSTDGVDEISEGFNDLYLLHSVGLTFNLGKFWGGSGNGNENIDKCPKLPKDMEQRKAKEGPKATKSKKKKRSRNGR